MSQPWSQVKKRMESEFLHHSLKGKVEFHLDRYRKSHDQWSAVLRVAYNKETIFKGDNVKAYVASLSETANEVVSQEEVTDAIFTLFHLSIDDALSHDDPMIRSLAILDRRTGKRRLQEMDPAQFTFPFQQTCYQLRQEN